MRYIAFPLLLLASCGEESPAPDALLARQAIREAIESYHESADKGDLDGMLKYLTEDVIMLSGTSYIHGKDKCETELEKRLESIEDKKRKTIVGKPEISLQGDYAVATYEASVDNLRAPISVTLRRETDQIWRIWHISELWPKPKDN